MYTEKENTPTPKKVTSHKGRGKNDNMKEQQENIIEIITC